METGTNTTSAPVIGGEARPLARNIMPFLLGAAVVGLVILTFVQLRHISHLDARLRTDEDALARLSKSHALVDMWLTSLEARDPAYNAAKVLVAWDPYQDRGILTVQNLSAPKAGGDYQLWVLDPGALTPINAGLVKADGPPMHFSAPSVGTHNPGFAVTLEPAGGSTGPSTTVLFAVAPSP